MLNHMRTTINLPDDLMRQAKKAALDSDSTLTEFIASAIREALAKRGAKNGKKPFKLITSGRGGVFPGIDLSNSAELLDIMDGWIDPRRR